MIKKEIIEYIIIENSNPTLLAEEVTRELHLGYKLHGNLISYYINPVIGAWYIQVMVSERKQNHDLL